MSAFAPGMFEENCMRNRFGFGALLMVGLVLAFVGCGSSTDVDSVTVAPSTLSLAAGATAQLTATGTVGHGNHPATSTNVTDTATWASAATSVATVSASGVVTAVAAGTTTITASVLGFGGLVASNAVTVTVTGGSGGGTGGSVLTAVTIIPGTQVVSAPNQTTQFIAIGTTSTGSTVDVTSLATWNSSSPQIARVTSTGLATGLSQGTATITAIASNGDGTVVTGTATFTVTNGAAEPFTAISISPGAQALSAAGQTGQLIALGTSGSTGLSQDVTNSSQVVWTSSVPTIASVSSYPVSPAGLVTGASAGQTTITAKLTNPDGSVVTATAVVTVTITAGPEPLLSLAIVPATVTVGNLQDTAQFLAFGTTSSSASVQDLTNSPTLTWLSSFPNDFPINTTGQPGVQAGVMTAYASGTAVVIAEASNPDGSVVTATATFNCPLLPPNPPLTYGSCFPGSQAPSLLATLTVYGTGLNTTDWLVTAPSATGTADVIHCGPGYTTLNDKNSVCIATYPVGTTVTLTTTTPKFGGWSSNCTAVPTQPGSATPPNSCTVTLSTNDTVGAIFN